MPDDCIFCRIANREIPATVVYDDTLLIAIRDINPVAPVHILIMPKKHIPDILHLTDIDAEMLGKVFEIAGELARSEGIAESGFRLVVNNGAAAGQTVDHIHFHLLGGRQLTWPPG